MNSAIFCFKGTGLSFVKKYFDTQFGNQYFHSKWVHYFPEFDSNIEETTWYPLIPLVKWFKESALEQQLTFREYVVKMNMFFLEHDLSEVNKLFIRLGGAKRILDTNPRLLKSHLNCIDITIIENKPGFYKGELNAPRFAAEWQFHSQEGVINGILAICGHKIKDYRIVEQSFYNALGTEYSRILFELIYI